MDVLPGQRYKHYKGKEYTILSLAHHTETDEKMVVYQGEYADPELGLQPIFVRPLTMFCEDVLVEGKYVPRFELKRPK